MGVALLVLRDCTCLACESHKHLALVIEARRWLSEVAKTCGSVLFCRYIIFCLAISFQKSVHSLSS